MTGDSQSDGKQPSELLKIYRDDPEMFRSDVYNLLVYLPHPMRGPFYRQMGFAVKIGDVNMFADYLSLAKEIIKELSGVINKHGDHNQYTE